jgi:hypothetical protein
MLVVTKFDRLARSLQDATDIADELTNKGVALNLGGAVYDPTDPVGRLLSNVLGLIAEFEADLIRACTREGLAIAKAAGKLRGRKPSSPPRRRSTWCSCTAPEPTRQARSPSCLASRAQRSTAPSSAASRLDNKRAEARLDKYDQALRSAHGASANN